MIHLFRDPRAIINSHIYTQWYKKHTNNSENDIKTNCHRIENDVIAALKLTKLYPERLMAVHYEDLYGNFQKFEKVYNFTGMTITPGVKRFLHEESSKSFSGTKNVKGHDSRFKYRETLSFDTVKIIDKHCAKALELLGLRTYSSASQLKDFNVNPVINKLPFTIE
ncbi:Sulfotransferase [Mactra antiquata]